MRRELPQGYEVTATEGREQPFTAWFTRRDGKRETFAFTATFLEAEDRCFEDAQAGQPKYGGK